MEVEEFRFGEKNGVRDHVLVGGISVVEAFIPKEGIACFQCEMGSIY